MEPVKRPIIAFQVVGTLAKELPDWFSFDYGEPIPRMVRRVHQHIEDNFEVVAVDPRITLGGPEAQVLQQAWSRFCTAHIGYVLPLVATAPSNAIAVVGTKTNQVFADRGATVDEVLAVLLTCLDGVEWASVPKLEAFKPDTAGSTIRFTELLEGVLQRV